MSQQSASLSEDSILDRSKLISNDPNDRIAECWTNPVGNTADDTLAESAELYKILSAKGIDPKILRSGLSVFNALRLTATAYAIASQVSLLEQALEQVERENEDLNGLLTAKESQVQETEKKYSMLMQRHASEMETLETLLDDAKMPSSQSPPHWMGSAIIDFVPEKTSQPKPNGDAQLEQVKSLKSQLQECQEELSAQKRIQSRLQAEYDATFETMTGEIKTLTAQLVLAQQESENKSKELEHLRKDFHEISLKEPPTQLVEDISTAASFDLVSELREEIYVLEQALLWEREGRAFQAQEAQSELKLLREKLKSMSEQTTSCDHEKIINEKNQQIAQLQASKTYYINELERLNEAQAHADSDLKVAHTQVTELTERIQGLNIAIDELNAEVKEKATACAEKDQLSERLAKKCETLQTRVLSLQTELTAIKGELKTVNEQAARHAKISEDKISRYENELQNYDKLKIEYENEKKKLIRSISVSQDESVQISDIIKRHESEIERLTKSTLELNKKVVTLKKAASELKKELDVRNRELHNKEAAYNQLDMDLSTLKGKHSNLTKQLAAVSSDLINWLNLLSKNFFIPDSGDDQPKICNVIGRDQSALSILKNVHFVLDPYISDMSRMLPYILPVKCSKKTSGGAVGGEQLDFVTDFGKELWTRLFSGGLKPVAKHRRRDLISFAAEFQRGLSKGGDQLSTNHWDTLTVCLEILYKQTDPSSDLTETEESIRSWSYRCGPPIVEHSLNKVIYYDEYHAAAAHALPTIQYSPRWTNQVQTSEIVRKNSAKVRQLLAT